MLGVVIPLPVDLSGLQPLDADLTAIAALTTTAYGRAFLTLANDAAFKAAILTALGLTGFTISGQTINVTAAGGLDITLG